MEAWTVHGEGIESALAECSSLAVPAIPAESRARRSKRIHIERDILLPADVQSPDQLLEWAGGKEAPVREFCREIKKDFERFIRDAGGDDLLVSSMRLDVRTIVMELVEINALFHGVLQLSGTEAEHIRHRNTLPVDLEHKINSILKDGPYRHLPWHVEGAIEREADCLIMSISVRDPGGFPNFEEALQKSLESYAQLSTHGRGLALIVKWLGDSGGLYRAPDGTVCAYQKYQLTSGNDIA